MYASAWRSFQQWAQAHGALVMLASPPLVAVYLGHLVEERRLSVVTIQVHKAALAAVHRVRGHQEQSDNMSVRTMIEKIARAHGESQRQRIGKPGDSVNKPEL